jgi:hypothetical protein
VARLRVLQPFEDCQVGTIIERPGGVANILALRKVGVLLPREETPEVDEAATLVIAEVPTPRKPRGKPKPKAAK